jgi:glutaredoxin
VNWSDACPYCKGYPQYDRCTCRPDALEVEMELLRMEEEALREREQEAGGEKSTVSLAERPIHNRALADALLKWSRSL